MSLQTETCPWCGERVELPLGLTNCTACGGRLWVTPDWSLLDLVRLLAGILRVK